jgi:formate hydrogenlyase transcriptional activator
MERPGQDITNIQAADDQELLDKIRRFRDLLLSVYMKCVGVRADEVDDAVNAQLRLVAEFWGLEQIVVYELREKAKRADILYRYDASRGTDTPYAPILSETLSGDTENPENDLPGLRFQRDSGLVLPVNRDVSEPSFLLFQSLEIRSWPEKAIEQLRWFADLLNRLLLVKRTSEFHRLLSEVSAVYINLPIEQIESALQKDFARLSRALDIEVCAIHIPGEVSGQLLDPILPFAWYIDEQDEHTRPFVEWHRWLELNPVVDPGSHPLASMKASRGELMAWTRIEDMPEEGERDKEVLLGLGVKSLLSVPIVYDGSHAAYLSVMTVRYHREWSQDLIEQLRLFGEVFVNAVIRKRSEQKLQKALTEIKELKERVEADYAYLKQESEVVEKEFAGIVGKSDALRKTAATIRQVGPTNATVLVLGETGCGKGLLARAIHTTSTRKERPFMQVNCAAISGGLIESELFGHEKGAFTGALSRRIGRFEAAAGTTLFLDEIGDLPLELQPKLLRVLEDGEFERVGGGTTIKTDVRVIAATNRDLEKEVEAGRFRRDLWYRLNVFPIVIPPLRERPDDIPLLLSHFTALYEKQLGKRFNPVPESVIVSLQAYSWPGNIRELKNVVERAVIATPPHQILCLELPRPDHVRAGESGSIAEEVKNFEREKLVKALEETRWVIEGPKGTARRLGITPTTLRRHIKNLNIKRPS